MHTLFLDCSKDVEQVMKFYSVDINHKTEIVKSIESDTQSINYIMNSNVHMITDASTEINEIYRFIISFDYNTKI